MWGRGLINFSQTSRQMSQTNYKEKGESRLGVWFRKNKIGNSLDIYIFNPEEFHFSLSKVVMNVH